MSASRIILLILLLPTLVFATSATQITSSGQLLNGYYANGQIGDYLIENQNIAVIVSDIGHTVHYGETGGNVIDAGYTNSRNDAVEELYLYLDDVWPRQAHYSSIAVVNNADHSIITVDGVDSNNSNLDITTDYILFDNDKFLTITTTFTNNGSSINNYEVGDAFTWGNCWQFAPVHGTEFATTTTELWVAGFATDVSYGYISPLGDIWGENGNGWVDVNVNTVSIGNGSSASFTRYLAVGNGDIGTVAEIMHDAVGTPTGSLECLLKMDDDSPITGGSINAYLNNEIYLQMTSTGDGTASTTLPAGSWRLEASVTGFDTQTEYFVAGVGNNYTYEFIFEGSANPTNAIGDTLTTIQKPLQNIPSFVMSGETLLINCEASPATTGWTAELVNGQHSVPLTITDANYNSSTTWWDIEAELPQVSITELYDLHVTGSGGIDDVTKSSVKVLSDFKEDYYFIQVTDTHLPDHQFSNSGGTPADSTEINDLRAVIADLNIINPEFVLVTGDLVNEGELEDYLEWRSYTRAQRLLLELDVPMFLVSGNHDIGGWTSTPPPDGTARRQWWRFFGWPRLFNPPAGAPEYTQNYSFDYGPVHYIGMEAYDNYDMWWSGIYGSESFTSGQLNWLNQDLAATSSQAQVMFFHYDFQQQLNLNTLGVEMALYGHIHRDEGSIYSQPFDLATDNTCDGARSYRLVRVSGSTLTPIASLSAGSGGQNLRIIYDPFNNGTSNSVTATLDNNQNQRFEHALVKFEMPSGNMFDVTGGVIQQVDNTGLNSIVHVGVDLLANSLQTVTCSLDVTGVEVPNSVVLNQNHPNPFNPSTSISYYLPDSCQTKLTIHDMRGHQIALLCDEKQADGEHEVQWDGNDSNGTAVASGSYIAKLIAGNQTRQVRMALVR